MPTQGSWRPLVASSVAAPSRVTVGWAIRIELVGLNATRTTTGWPVLMPPAIPPAWLARNSGEPLSPGYRARLRDMIVYLSAVTRPDGLMPQVGDADDGRLHIFEGYATTTPQDARHLFGPAGLMFDEPAWQALGGDGGAWEAGWWGLDLARAAATPSPQSPTPRLFRDAGIATARTTAGMTPVARLARTVFTSVSHAVSWRSRSARSWKRRQAKKLRFTQPTSCSTAPFCCAARGQHSSGAKR